MISDQKTAQLAVPAYVHPSVGPQVWHRLAEVAARLRFVVVNVESGPGESLDPAYPQVLARLHAARVRTIGYVDTDYGRRDVDDVVRQARSWVRRYGVHGVFLDQVAADFGHLEYYADCALGARASGAQFVVMNPGTECHVGFADIANVTVTFEGTWDEYTQHRPDPALSSRPADRFCHLVYQVPPELVRSGPARAAALHAGTSFFTPGGGSNPWDQLPESLIEAASSHSASARPATARTSSWGERRYAGGHDESSAAAASSRSSVASTARRRWPPRLRRTPHPISSR